MSNVIKLYKAIRWVFLFSVISLPAIADRYSYADAVQKASPSVVNLYTSYPARGIELDVDEDEALIWEFFGGESRQFQNKRHGMGSGVIVDSKGYILTNAHLVVGADSIRVTLSDKREAKAKIIGIDVASDLAVLKINLNQLKSAVFGNSEALRVGDVVLAIGNAFGLNQTVTQGIVSAIDRHSLGVNQFEDFIQTDAAINPGNSGGALITASGDLVGINAVIYSQTGTSNGIGFAIPIDLAKRVMNQLISKGRVERGFLGVHIKNLDAEQAKQFGYPYDGGVVVESVLPASPADKSHLKGGDIITKINGQNVTNAQAFFNSVSHLAPKTKVKLSYMRMGKEGTVDLVVGLRDQRRQ